jgi:Domain of unknown function (DUF4372)
MKRVCGIFSQILQLIPRDRFEAAVEKHQAEGHARGVSSWGQMVGMLFCQLGQAKSLREIVGGLQASEGKLRHLGLPDAPRPVHIGIRQRSSTVAIIRNRISSTVGRLPEAVGGCQSGQ